ncbi:hypothetical protein ACQP1O_20510 [Nocardia sp. CA-151230]|uniref:hypothetical protein n=1 Tax=Nocardia sp. CA-151230 TaxID=3239982 RepID=UPI003D8FF1C9
MFGISIYRHEAISYMSLGYAVEVVERAHANCFTTTCPKRRQAMSLINEAARKARAATL